MSRLLALIFCLVLAAPVWAERVVLSFLHVNDVYQHRPSEGRGGLAELMTQLRAERQKDPAAVFTFGGDLLSPSLASQVTRGAHMVDLFNDLGTDYAVPGNHEFDFGTANYLTQVGRSRFPWLAANLRTEDGQSPGGQPATAIRDMKGVRVGFFGLISPAAARLSNAAGLLFGDEREAARRAVDTLAAQGAQVIVALTHLDLAQDRALAEAVPGIHLILGGHDHDAYALYEGHALILKAGHDAHWLAVAELAVERDPAGQTRVRPLAWRFQPIEGLPADPDVARRVQAVDAALGPALEQVLGRTETPLDSRSERVRSEETAMGNLIADALRAALDCDVALVNGGGIRGNRLYAAGTGLSRRDLATEMPFDNKVMRLELDAATLRAALEWGLSGVERRAGRFPQVSGLELVWDPARPAGQRLVAVRVGGLPLDPTRRYRLATLDYLARGGDGYAMLAGLRDQLNGDGPRLANVVMDYLMARGTVAPRVEGRIVTR